MKVSANKKSVLGLIVISVIILTSGYVINQLIVDLDENQKLVQHTYLVINKIASTLSIMQDIEKGSRAYVITKNQDFLEYYNTAVMNVNATVNELKDLETYIPVKQKILDLENLIAQKTETVNSHIAFINAEKTNQFVESASIAKGRQLMDEIGQTIKEIENTEYTLLNDRSNEAQISFSNLSNLSIITSAIIIGIVIIVYVILDKDAKAKTKQEQKQQAEYTDTKEKQQLEYTDATAKQQLDYTDTTAKQQLEYADAKAKQQAEYTDAKEKSFSQKPNIIDVLLSRKEADIIVDSTTLIKNVQNRINNALENGYEYTRTIDSSEKFLRKSVFQQINMVVLYVDLVGSTKMSAELPSDKLSTLISSFSQEMAYVINAHNGYVLKFVGDAVIGYFVENETNSFQTVDNAVGCAESMMKVVNQGINPILIEKAGLSEISIKIGIDFGKNVIVRYGADEKMAYVDLLGPTMNLASKIQDLAKPNQILVGQEIHDRLHPSIQEFFSDITNGLADNWQHYLKNSDQVYRVYRYKYE